MTSFLSAGNDEWKQADFGTAKFDPDEVLDPSYDPDERWASELLSGKRKEAAREYVRLLREGPSRINLDQSIPLIRLRWFGVAINNLGGTGFDADDVVNLRYVGTYGIEHQFEEEIDWTYDGSHGRTPEWTWQMNRHLHWINLADAYQETGDAKYAEAWERELRSWIEQCPRPDDNGNRKGSAWRTLDTGIRAGSTWPYAFEIFRDSPHVSDEAIWLFVAAQREHALHLQRYPTGANWKIMETNGLGHAGMMFPEMEDAERFIATAIQRAQDEIAAQFFPDGTHQEFAPHYAAAGCIANFYALARLAARNEIPLPDDFWDSLAHTVDALARISDPEGIAPGLNDSLQIDINQLYADVVAGREPGRATPPWSRAESDLLPHGGYAVFRRENSYALFDAGPRGTSHYHNDDLQLLTYFGGHYFSIDPGSPNYTNEPLSRHLRTSAAHNVVLLNGKIHEPAIKIARPHDPMPVSFHGDGAVQAAAARRTLLQPDGDLEFDHERVVLDVEGLGWVVLDRLFPPDREQHAWEWLWHMPVDSVRIRENLAKAAYEDGPAIVLACAASGPGTLSVAEGQEDPEPRGWMNRRGEKSYLPIPAIRFETGKRAGPVWAVTVQAPFSHQSEARAIDLKASREGSEEWLVTVEREGIAYRFEFAGGDEIREVRSWRGDQPLGSVTLGGHTLTK